VFRQSTFSASEMTPLQVRLADALADIARTEGKWFDGTKASIEDRRLQCERVRSMARQYCVAGDVDIPVLAAMEIDHNLSLMVDNLKNAETHFVSRDVREAQTETPHYSINVLDF
jgi:hypothetical protein